MIVSNIIICLCLLTINTSAALLSKRQVLFPDSCRDANNAVATCSPTATSVWYNNTKQTFNWKYNNPLFDQYTAIDLYLLHRNDSGYYLTQKLWPSLKIKTGMLMQLVDDSWYPEPIKDNSPNVSWTMYAYVVGAGFDIQSDLALIPQSHNYFPAPQSFTLIQSANNVTSGTTSSTTPSSTDGSVPSTNPSSDTSNFPGWKIAVICIVVVLVVAAAAILFWVIRRNRNKKIQSSALNGNDEKIPLPIVETSH